MYRRHLFERLLSTPAQARRRARFVNVPLVTHRGRPVRFYDDLVLGRTVLINFLYTSCTERCPLTTSKLAEVQRILGSRMGREVFIHSITIDPHHDTVPVLRDYAARAGAGPGWTFFTGDPHDIGRIRANFGDDPAVAYTASNHLNLIALGVEPLERWSGFPAWTHPALMVQYLSWAEARGARPSRATAYATR